MNNDNKHKQNDTHFKDVEQFEIISNSEINQSLFNNLPVGIISSLILATVLFVHLTELIDKTALIVWYSAVLIVLTLRTILLFWFRKTKNETKLGNYHSIFFILGSSLSAILWGVLGSFLMPADIFYQTFIIIFVSGVIAGSTISLAASYLASMLYLFLSLLPIVIWEAIQVLNGHQMYLGLFIAMVIYMLYSAITAHKNSEFVQANIRLKNRNRFLIGKLKDHLNQIELFSQMGTDLDHCSNNQDVVNLCKTYLPNIFPEFSGGIFILTTPGNRLHAQEVWGRFSDSEILDFDRDECLAIKNNTLYISHDMDRCAHCADLSKNYVCAPLKNTLKLYGILVFILKQPLLNDELISSQKALISRIANNISFALSTIEYKLLLEEEATHDKLTGLYNRRYLDSYFNIELSRVKRKSASISVLMIDIDHFKKFNDQYGHETGDEVLRQLGAFLKNSVRGTDFACRYGGEEFIIILPESGLDIALKRAESIRDGVKLIKVLKDGQPIPMISVSIGVSLFPEHGDTQAKVIDAADKALYMAKNAGRDAVCVAKT